MLPNHSEKDQLQVVETLSKVYLVMEYAGGGDLYTYVLDNEKLDESEASHLFAQVVAGVCHLVRHKSERRDSIASPARKRDHSPRHQSREYILRVARLGKVGRFWLLGAD